LLPKVSVVIPFYNCPYVDRAIRSVLNQSYPNVEVIVVNDGSTQHAEKVFPYLDRIVYVEKENGGTATALNAGIRRATGAYFAWLSSDDMYHPVKLMKQYQYLQHVNGSFCYTAYHHVDPHDRVVSNAIRVHFLSRVDMMRTLLNVCFINGSSVLMHMSAFQQVGLFDETLLYAHDYDMWLRMLPHYELSYLDEPLLMYRVHENMGTKKYAEAAQKEAQLVQERHREAVLRLVERGGGLS
jgi:glycosyltransferase involved in cell wall biosynthesis